MQSHQWFCTLHRRSSNLVGSGLSVPSLATLSSGTSSCTHRMGLCFCIRYMAAFRDEIQWFEEALKPRDGSRRFVLGQEFLFANFSPLLKSKKVVITLTYLVLALKLISFVLVLRERREKQSEKERQVENPVDLELNHHYNL